MKASSTMTRQLVVAHKRDLLLVFAKLRRLRSRLRGAPTISAKASSTVLLLTMPT